MKLLDFIICDDIRIELGNKVSLIGVYTETFEIIDPKVTWPFPAAFGFFIRVLPEKSEAHMRDFEFHVMRNGESKIKIDGQIIGSEPGAPFVLHFNLRPFVILEPGTLDFELRFPHATTPIIVPLSSLKVVSRLAVVASQPLQISPGMATPH